MKRINLFLGFLTLILLTACQSTRNDNYNYNVVLLGDIHYDKVDLHDKAVYEKFNPKVPMAKGVLNKHGLFSWRNHTLWATESRGWDPGTPAQNETMWEIYLPGCLDTAAKSAKTAGSRYVIQLGDMVQGDAGRQDLHEKMISGGLNALTSRFPCPVLAVVGNHDTRGPGGTEAWQKIMEPHFEKSVKNIVRKGSNYYFFLGDDLFYFHDLMNPDLDLLEEAFKKRNMIRYTFFISHVPVIPAEKKWISDIITDDPERLLELLLNRNAIVLSGHTHNTAIVHYDDKKNERRITQFVMNTTMRYPELHKNFAPKVVYSTKPVKMSKAQESLWKSYFSGNIKTELLSPGSGYTILRINNSGVFADYYNVNQKPVTFRLR